jgi:hypothetical protein
MKKLIVDCSTGEHVEVDLTDAEISEMQKLAAEDEALRLAREAEAERIANLKTSARNKLVAGQPLTEEEAATLVI